MARKGGSYLTDKIRTAAIILAAILGCTALVYLGGMLSQLLTNYSLWLASDGMSGQTTMKPVSWNPAICFPLAFTVNGIKGMLGLLLIGGGIFAYVKLHDRFDSKEHDPRGFSKSKSGIYGTASLDDRKGDAARCWRSPRLKKRKAPSWVSIREKPSACR